MMNLKLNRCVMLLAIFAIAFNLFSNSLYGSAVKSSADQSLSVLKDIKTPQNLGQSLLEDLDVSEVEEDFEEESTDNDDDESDVFTNFFSSHVTFQNYLFASSTPYLKPLRSQEIPLFLLFENIRL